MFKYKENQLPPVFDKMFIRNIQIHNINTRHKQCYRVPLVKSRLANNFVTKTGVIFWNNLSMLINANESIKVFKKDLIENLITKY